MTGRNTQADRGLSGEALSRLAEVLVPTSLIASLMFYFGWMRTRVLFADLGLSEELMNYSNTDYILRSIDVIAHPVRVLIAALLVAIGAHLLFTRLVIKPDSPPGQRRCATGVLIAIGLGGLLTFDRIYGLARSLDIHPFPAAAGWLASIVLVAYGASVLVAPSTPTMTDSQRRVRLLVHVVFGALVVIGLFLLTAQYARVVGHRQAEGIVQSAGQRPDLVIYSEIDLGLQGVGVVTNRQGGLYRTAGLKYLAESGGRLLVYPASAALDEIILIDSAALTRFEFVDSEDDMP